MMLKYNTMKSKWFKKLNNAIKAKDITSIVSISFCLHPGHAKQDVSVLNKLMSLNDIGPWLA